MEWYVTEDFGVVDIFAKLICYWMALTYISFCTALLQYCTALLQYSCGWQLCIFELAYLQLLLQSYTIDSLVPRPSPARAT